MKVLCVGIGVAGEVDGSLILGTWGFSLGEAKQRNLYTSWETTDTLGTPLPISLKWLECSHQEMWDLN